MSIQQTQLTAQINEALRKGLNNGQPYRYAGKKGIEYLVFNNQKEVDEAKEIIKSHIGKENEAYRVARQPYTLEIYDPLRNYLIAQNLIFSTHEIDTLCKLLKNETNKFTKVNVINKFHLDIHLDENPFEIRKEANALIENLINSLEALKQEPDERERKIGVELLLETYDGKHDDTIEGSYQAGEFAKYIVGQALQAKRILELKSFVETLPKIQDKAIEQAMSKVTHTQPQPLHPPKSDNDNLTNVSSVTPIEKDKEPLNVVSVMQIPSSDNKVQQQPEEERQDPPITAIFDNMKKESDVISSIDNLNIQVNKIKDDVASFSKNPDGQPTTDQTQKMSEDLAEVADTYTKTKIEVKEPKEKSMLESVRDNLEYLGSYIKENFKSLRNAADQLLNKIGSILFRESDKKKPKV